MGIDTYVNTVITASVTIIVGLLTVLLPMIFTENSCDEQRRGKKKIESKKNKRLKIFLQMVSRRLSKYHKVSMAFIGFGVLILAVATVTYRILKPSTYNEIINKAEFEFESRNYEEAARHYHNAVYVAYDKESKVAALYCEGACHFQLGLIQDDDNHLSQALTKYYSIINNKKYKNTEYYQDALIDSSYALRELYGKWDDEKLLDIINQLENTYDFSDIENVSLEKVDLMNKVALEIAIYYKYAANQSFETGNKGVTKELSDKAIYYYNVVCQLMPQADMIHFKNTDLLCLYLEISELMLKGSISSEDYTSALTNFNNTINFCKSAIDTFEMPEDDIEVLNCYFRLIINLGKTYYLMSGLAGEEYLFKAFEELKPLLYLDNGKDTEYVLLDAGYYLILTGKCTEEEIDIIISRYESQLDEMTIENKNYIMLVQSVSNALNSIIEIYGHNNHALELREELSVKLNNLEASGMMVDSMADF